jgi:3-phenylpropionate/trans-cinnamate dioxygenase ferredoxin reductase subunit
MEPPRTVVIAGGGVAAERCAFGLRKRGFDGRIAMVAREPHLPYDRTLVSKDLLQPSPPLDEAALHPREAYEEQGIEVRLEVEATRLDVASRQLELSDGATLRWDRLVLCTGGEPVLPAALDAPGVRVLRDLRDADGLQATLQRCSRLAIVGGGFIGGEVASNAAARGVEVTIVEALDQPLARVVGREVGERVAELHRRNGVEVLTRAPVVAIRAGSGGFTLELAEGRSLAADAVVVGTGMRPCTAWLEGSPLRIDAGVVTDAACRTEVPGILAAGDCARWFNPRYNGLMRVEHWDTARRHGTAVAAAALGDEQPFDPVPFFWSDQHGVKLQWVGYAPAWDDLEIEEENGGFAARYSLDGRLVAAFAAGRPKAIAAARRELMTTPTTKEER